MPEDAGPGPAPATALPSDPDDIAALLPFHLLRSQILPPAPNRRKSASDWLPEFGGAAWVAYGASSLLVISHFPNPLYEHETLVGSFLQQVIEPPPPPDAGDEPGDVNAVRWCPARPSEGEIAAAAGNCVWFYSPDAAEDDPSSFRWRQTAGIVQSFAVEAIEWTGSGDGLVAAGISVVLWVRKNMTWEMAWKSSSDIPQTMVSTTLFTEGPLATVACSSNCMSDAAVFGKKSSPLLSKECSYVSVYHRDGKSGFTKFQLFHPQPVSMIQWRPSTVARLEKDTSCSWRNVLLSCCLDGTVRLWSEIENSRIKKASKDAHGKKSYKRAYHVIAVIEINQHLRGTIDMDIFISWATECGDIICEVEGGNYCLAPEVSEHDHIGKCEWVISVGPRSSLTLWAIHCLDDTSPLRFPRVTLWKTLDLMEFKECKNFKSDLLHLKDQPVFVKAVASRSHPYAPPNHCSLLQLLADNSFSWLQFYSPMSNSKADGSSCQTSMEKCLPCFAGGVLNQDSHTGKIIQLDVYPCNSEVELAASLDSSGSLFFWSLPTVSSYTLGSQAVIHPAWKLMGKVILQDKSSVTKYSAVRWAPVVLGENRFLLLGHADGIDCFVIQVSEKGETIFCHKILSIPFDGVGHEGPPDHIFATAMASTYGCSIFSNGFLLFGIWMGKFQALSWKVILHLEDPSGSICKCDFDPQMVSVLKRNVIDYAGKQVYATVDMCSSFLPDPHNHDQVTSVAVLPPDDQALSVQHYATSSSSSEMNSCMYTMVTGCSDGTLKLWRICYAGNAADSKGEFLPWEIVGMFNAHQGPVSAVSLSTCGGKIATIGMDGQSNSASLHIWEPVRLIGGGSFLLEDVISLSGAVIALNWMTIGDGRLLLGVCMPNTLCIYSEKRFTNKDLKSKKSKEMNIWFCITQSHVHYVCQDFCWGPKLSPVLVHEKHISLFSQWSSIAENMLHEGCSPTLVHGTSNDLPCALYTERDLCNAKESSLDESKHKNNQNGQNLKFVGKPYDFVISGLHSILDISDRLHGCLEVYHPQALMHHLYSGNWKHALAILRHLVESIKSDDAFASILENSKSEHPSRKILDIQFLAYFQETVSSSLSNKKLQWGQDICPTMLSFESPRNLLQFGGIDLLTNAPKSISTPIPEKSEITWLINTLEKTHTIPGITDNEKTQILSIVDILGEVSGTSGGSVYQSLDEPGGGTLFWVGVRYQHLYFLRKYGRSAAAEELVVDSAVASWAFLSDCKENLFDSIFSVESSWLEMRNMGVGYWFINTTQLRTKMEKLARSQYLKRKDPKDCALLYLALNRVQVLAGLFKISRDEKDKLLVAFLSRNFQEEKNKAAALKNAYVLMGRHQLELAIAFFLLGGDPSSAVTVCAKNLGDEQLALVICRLIEGFGGPLEHQLISSFLLPSAMEKGDYWLSSMLEWTLGNYSRSLNNLIDSQMGSITNKPTTFANRAVFSDPTIGHYCAILAAKNSLKNAIGDYMAIMLSKLAMLMTAIALKRCGLPFEAVECLISSFDMESKDQINLPDTRSHDIFHGILNLFSSSGACNWMLRDVACHLELNAKLNIALQYITKLLCDHLNCPCADLAPPDKLTIHGCDTHKEELCIRKFKDRLNVVMLTFEQKYSLDPADLGNKILILSHNKGFLYFGYLLLDNHLRRGEKTDCHSPDGFTLNPTLHRMLAKSSKEISYLLARYVVFCSLTDSILKLNYSSNFGFRKNYCGQFYPVNFCLQNFLYLLSTFRPVFKLYNGGILNEDLTSRTFAVVDFLEYCVHVAFAWIKKDVKGLILMVRLILDVSANDQSSFGVSACELMKVLHQTSGLMVQDMSSGDICNSPDSNCEGRKLKQFDSRMASISEDEVWQLIGVCLWLYIFTFAKRHLTSPTGTEMHDGESDMLNLFPFFNGKIVMTLLEYIFSSLSKQLTALLRQKALKGLPVSSLPWLYESGHSQPRSAHHNSSETVNSLQPTENEDIESLLDLFCESICFNSIDEQEVALASNRKGLLFFNWKVEKPFQEQADYIWSESDWPKSGWAGCESTPIPTFVSTGVGLGGKKGVHLGLGGATTGYGPLARPGRDLTGGGAFGIPGYAGIGASGLGWGEQEDFTDYVDPPATVENIRSCALSSHPSKPFLLVGSSNTHVYLWEFGKDRALATYGVLPAANVPPPYALASISALKFDNCGHRFVTAALDGTVCTWQLEVGGRNNVHPTESSLCFNNHALDVAFLGASGSILTAAGYSSNGLNVVVWDTLAPPSTSQVSLVCHEGGARSLSVFDSGIGTGSVSPLIVTGGKGGDVGLHDFRYIATGKSKRHRQSSDQDLKPSSNTEAFKNGENANGMIWYIPKAHSGMKYYIISTIPHTSLFLTGSKDGDVKLWDAKKSQLVFHWPKLHDKHTFLQPNSRGFAGVVRINILTGTDILLVHM
ncbi:hypothetical protein J5N97_004497 [Dioscorea zingiberensis]|uniref:RAVE complex protein Rav1 C-terminal domain-containing protein n=1 Tax=Dioscorea zingiberensis TaxID=325984 RepID=A0A9D5D6S3_9LILI|nr:hypothetical protein J5N97_004497 [Dioscorea zingiberensis]